MCFEIMGTLPSIICGTTTDFSPNNCSPHDNYDTDISRPSVGSLLADNTKIAHKPKRNYDDYIFHVLSKDDVEMIRNHLHGERVLYRKKGQLPLLWILMPQNEFLDHIEDMKKGIVYFNSVCPYLTSYKIKDRGTIHSFSLLDNDIEEALYVKHCYSSTGRTTDFSKSVTPNIL